MSDWNRKPYGLNARTWRTPECFYYDTPEAAAAAIVKVYGPDAPHVVVGPVQPLVDAIARLEALCVEWDRLSKGETPTTARIRAAINGRSTT